MCVNIIFYFFCFSISNLVNIYIYTCKTRLLIPDFNEIKIKNFFTNLHKHTLKLQIHTRGSLRRHTPKPLSSLIYCKRQHIVLLLTVNTFIINALIQKQKQYFKLNINFFISFFNNNNKNGINKFLYCY